MGTQATPRHLYKYLPDRLDRIEDVLVHNRLYFSSPTEFNDPFDCARGVRVPDPEKLAQDDEQDWREYILRLNRGERDEGGETAERHAVDDAVRRADFRDPVFIREQERIVEEAIVEEGRGFGVLCLSATPGSVGMWAHYASNHRGVVIEFETGKLRSRQGSVRCFPVCYEDSLPTVREFLDAMGSPEPLEFLHLFFCRKSTEWRHEREWRIFTGRPNQQVACPPSVVRRVIFGHKMPEPTKALIAAWVRDRDPPARLADSVPSGDKFKMVPVDRGS